MSKIKVTNSVIHTPSFKEYKISGQDLMAKYQGLGLEIRVPSSDNWYYHTDDVGAASLINHLVLKSSLYKPDRRDCD